MENLLKVIFLGLIQGITEFLPVSSSGHLVLLKHFMGVEADHGPTLEIVLHSGTLLSILVFYAYRIKSIAVGVLKKDRVAIRFVVMVLMGCVPAILLAFLAKDQLEDAFSHPRTVAITLMLTGVFLILTKWAPAKEKALGWKSALIIGLVQAVAMLPGVSRSGSTLGTARFLGVNAKEATEYSFLMLVPLLMGASLLTLKDLLTSDEVCNSSSLELILGFFVSAVVGYFSLKWLLILFQRGQFWCFGVYCLLAGFAAFLFLSI